MKRLQVGLAEMQMAVEQTGGLPGKAGTDANGN